MRDGGPGKIVVASVPDIVNGNPYQKLFYGQLERYNVDVMEHFELYAKSILRNRNKLDIIHFHWYEAGKPNVLHEIISILHFTLKLILCKLFSIRIIWTAHNLFPHDSRRTVFRYLRRFILAHFSDLIIIHFENARKHIGSLFHVDLDKFVCMHHGLFSDAYSNLVNKEAARRHLSLEQEKIILLYFGAIRRYKNVEALIQAFKKIHNKDIILLIAGSVPEEPYKKELLGLINGDNGIRHFFKHIDDDQVQFYFNSADCVILPYKQIFTSGAAMLSLTFKKPIIMKKCDFSDEYLTNDNSIVMDNCTEDNLAKSIAEFIEEKNRLVVTNDYVKKYEWAYIVDELFKEWRIKEIFTKKSGGKVKFC